MDIWDPIVKGIVGEATKSLIALLKRKRIAEESLGQQLGYSIENHLTRVLNWSQVIQFYGMAKGLDTKEKTISLSIDAIPRKFRGNRATEKIDEKSLLSSEANQILLGDPGSGKTTTIRRLARHVLLEQPDSPEDAWEYPIVILLREMQSSVGSEGRDVILAASLKESRGLSAFEMIARTINLGYSFKEVEEREPGDPLYRKISVPFVEGERLDELVPDILDSTGAILFLDGLDEVPSYLRADFEKSVELLQARLRRCKIILSCRSGDFTRHIEGFEVVEICPLEKIQIDDLAAKWLEDGSEFIEKISALPFFDLATRPLFLCQLIVLYQNSGYIPDEPSSIYRKTISLLLEEWDRTRGIQRTSKYARFYPEKKLDFLSALAYHLTYQIRVKRFSRRNLTEAYLSIYDLFGLPKGEAVEVSREIETHTGIIVESGFEFFEFSHLSLQEYLCAYYLVREPFAEHVIDYLREFPSPIAVAIALSANPSNWLSSLLLKPRIFSEVNEDAMASLLSRMDQERPSFTPSRQLGFALLKVIFRYGERLREHVELLLSKGALRRSLVDALGVYSVDFSRSNSTRYWLEKRPGSLGHTQLDFPEEGSLPMEVFKKLSQEEQLTIRKEPWGSSVRGVFEG